MLTVSTLFQLRGYCIYAFSFSYPWVMKYSAYPIGGRRTIPGHQLPQTIATAEELRQACRGFLKCTVRAPAMLDPPVLPARMGGKLKFVLCATCGEKGDMNKCTHTDAKRDLSGTWATPELELALDNGYKIVQVSEVR